MTDKQLAVMLQHLEQLLDREISALNFGLDEWVGSPEAKEKLLEGIKHLMFVLRCQGNSLDR